MELHLFPQTSIAEIRKQFSSCFSYLKLEFFENRHAEGEGNRMEQKIEDNVILSQLPAFQKEGIFFFNPETSVTEFEQELQREFGLPVQVFRHVNGAWLETIQTDHLSLEKQNSMGEASSKPMRINFNSLFL